MKVSMTRGRLLLACTLFTALPAVNHLVASQVPTPGTTPPVSTVELPKDALGRTTPRGTVLGFLSAAHKGNTEAAVQYLNTPMRGEPAGTLAHQLVAVLDRRLPPRLNLISDKPEGSRSDPLNPDQELVGTIRTNNGDLGIYLERVDRGKSGMVWLFSGKTLKAIPDVFQELRRTGQDVFPEFMVRTRIANISLFEWFVLLIGPAVIYLITALLGRFLNLIARSVQRKMRQSQVLPPPELLPKPIRLLLVALTIRWLLPEIGLSLVARQICSATSIVILVAACIWLLILVNSRAERYLIRQLQNRDLQGIASVLRLSRRVIDLLFIFAGGLLVLYYFGVNLTAALAGLGVGGVAVALAAQKTLENVIGGVSLILDRALTVGDTLKLGDLVGTIEDIGLRSTRIRTLDRTMVVVPNGQIANATIETLSARDKFWFHPVLSLRFETSPAQILSVVAGVRDAIHRCPSADTESVRVRFIRVGTYSFDLEIFSYVFARDWAHFLEIQESLLLEAMTVVKQVGVDVAYPSQTMHFSPADSGRELAAVVLKPAQMSAVEQTTIKSA